MKLILNGGGVGEKAREARKIVADKIDKSKKILYVPFAWPDSTYKGCYEFMTNELSDIDCAGIDMVTSEDDLFSKDFTDYAFIYIGGGNTFKLLKMLKDSNNFEKIRDYLLYDDGIIYGGSAGAIIFGHDLDSCKTDDKNEVNLQDVSGFNMVKGYSLLCHYTSRNEYRTEESTKYLLELSKQKPIIAIPEEDTIYITDNSIEFYGSKPYYVFENGIKEEKIPIKKF